MNDNKKFLIIVIALSILVFIASVFYKNGSQPAKMEQVKVDENILVKPQNFAKGVATAPVTIVEFLDPECEACRAMHPIMGQLLKEYDGKVKLVIRYMPLHKNSMYAAAVLEEAREQGKFEEALEILFENQPVWGDHQSPQPNLIPTFLEKLDISKDSLKPDLVIAKHSAKIEEDKKDGFAVGANRTPTFFVNGVILEQIGYEPVKRAIEEALEELK